MQSPRPATLARTLAPMNPGPAAATPAQQRPSRIRSPLVRRLGRTDYLSTWRAMQRFTAARDATTRDELWLTEHEPIYTLGVAGRREHLRASGAIPVVQCDRGGQVTYHGPGQVVLYALVDLRRRGLGVRSFVRLLEAAVIDLLGAHRISAYGRVDAPGVYVTLDRAPAKIAALGLKVRNGASYHGLALNVDMDLGPFLGIDPCGHAGLRVTQTRELGLALDPQAAGDALALALRVRLEAGA